MPQIQLNQSRLILCEGVEDAVFLRELRNNGRITDCNIVVVKDLGGVSGVTGFGKALAIAVQLANFDAIVRHIILVADRDDGGGKTFANLCKQIDKANKTQNVSYRYPVPAKPFVRKGGRPSMTIVLMPPDGTKGALACITLDVIGKHLQECGHT